MVGAHVHVGFLTAGWWLADHLIVAGISLARVHAETL